MGKSDYILLESYGRNDEGKDSPQPELCWRLSYDKEEDVFLLQNSASGKITKTGNPENFMKIFIDDMNHSIYGDDSEDGRSASVGLYLKKELYSQYKRNSSGKIPEQVVLQYITALKDIL